jgi:4-amino-4-deoxy-L-arabinose transferase-like glycosyltransferase
MSEHKSANLQIGKFAHLHICIFFILIAFALRVWALDVAPPGLTHDEAAHLHDARRIWEGYRPIYLTSAYGREPLYDYATAPLVGLAGMRVFTGRLASAFWGTALVALLYAWTARALDRPTALLAAAFMALSFWPLSTSRQALRSITNPVTLTAALLLFWRAVYPTTDSSNDFPWHRPPHRPSAPVREQASRSTDSSNDFSRSQRLKSPLRLSPLHPPGQVSRFILAGAILGLSWYTYMPARITWLAPTLLGLSLALTDRPRWRRVRGGLGLMLLTMALVAAPLLVYLAQHPQLEVRVDELAAPLRALQQGDSGPLWNRAREAATLLSHRGDVHWMYNISGRALLPPALAALFYLGLLIVAYEILRWRRPAHGLLALWLLLGLAPALVTGLESSSLRAIAAQPAVFVIAALPPVALGRRLWPRMGQRAQAGTIALTVAALALLGAQSAHDYFHVWAKHRDTRTAYHSHVVQIARYLQAQPDDTPVGISTLYPGPLHDPYAIDVALGREDLKRTMRWYDARFALVFPDAAQSRAVFPALAPLDAALWPLFAPTARLLERVELQPDDLSPWFEVYTWQPRQAQANLPLSAPVDVGHLVAFVGHQLNTSTLPPGGSVELLTFWRVQSPIPNPTPLRSGDYSTQYLIPNTQYPFVFFTHALDTTGQIIGQQDRLDAPAWNWSPGDLLVQLHRFSLQADLSPGLYPLEIGVYVREPGYPRLPVYDSKDPSLVSDHILLPPIEVVAP